MLPTTISATRKRFPYAQVCVDRQPTPRLTQSQKGNFLIEACSWLESTPGVCCMDSDSDLFVSAGLVVTLEVVQDLYQHVAETQHHVASLTNSRPDDRHSAQFVLVHSCLPKPKTFFLWRLCSCPRFHLCSCCDGQSHCAAALFHPLDLRFDVVGFCDSCSCRDVVKAISMVTGLDWNYTCAYVLLSPIAKARV